ncbi:MAG: hypothetical protein DVB25_02950 [Verrucomicrobia bacterium]|nr:MAG: hypothetical protein DVB25_02950 [Verrucomicrobiota bacterium]
MAASHGDWAKARDEAANVLQVRQNDAEAYRIWAQALAKLGDPLACTAAIKLVSESRATSESRLEALRVVVAQAPQAVAWDLYNNLPQALTAQAEFRAAITALRIQSDESELAEKELREVLQPGDSPDVHLALLRLLCCRPDAQRVAEARSIFAELVAAKASDAALAALSLLGAVPGGLAAGAPLPDLPAWLRQQEKATASHRLLGINPAIDAQPEAADHWYSKAIARFLATDPGPLCTWLIEHGQAGMAAKVLEKPARVSPDAYLARLHALLLLEQRSALEEALRKPPVAVDLVEIEIVRAKYAMLCGDPIGAHTAWTRAQSRAAFDTTCNRLIDIARCATACHAMDAAENAWVEAIRLGRGPLPLYRDLLPVYSSLASQGRSEDLLTIFQVLRRLEPANCELQNHASYFKLIHAIESPAQVATTMHQLLEQNDRAAFYATLMLAEMLDGRAAEALTRLPKLRDSQEVAPMMLRALEGSARMLVGETEVGTRLLDGVDWQGFMSQERSVFRNLLVQHRRVGLPVTAAAQPKFDASSQPLPPRSNAVGHLAKERVSVMPQRPPLVR